MRGVQGFTLIELLIVVLIIAILAAIAVPNFLEFQTRAKVSRTKSDMRVIATALEAYFVDNNAYPLDKAPHDLEIASYSQITTPIAYMSSLPLDVFKREDFPEKHYFDYAVRTRGLPGMPNYWLMSVGPNNRWDIHDFTETQFLPRLYAEFQPNAETALELIYDPTNGTTSYGEIARNRKGFVDEIY